MSGTRSELASRALAVVMAGGSGTRLAALTRWEAKPALPFGGHYRNVDFTLSNCVNSGIRRVGLLTQYKAHSLIQHVHQAWKSLRPDAGEFVEVWPAQQRLGESWYLGTADAVYQNGDIIRTHAPRHVVVLAGDHVYKMNYCDMLETHITSRADATVGAIEVPVEEASSLGVLETDRKGRVLAFREKPDSPVPGGKSGTALGSMGIYVFGADFLFERLAEDARDPHSSHDFGYDILPALAKEARVVAHVFRSPDGGSYWRDVGTVDSYWRANMELLAEVPPLNLFDRSWPIHTYLPQRPPSQVAGSRTVTDTLLAAGCFVMGDVRRSILFTGSAVGPGSVIEDALILPGARVGPGSRVRRTIVDSGCVLPDGSRIGMDPDDDARRFHVSPEGVVVVTVPEEAG